jgi:hypothetical protein
MRLELNAFARQPLKALVDSLGAGGALVPVRDVPALFAEVHVVIHLPGDAHLTLPGKVVNHAGDAGVYVQFTPGRALTMLEAALESATQEWGMLDLFGEVDVVAQIREMTLREKIELAKIGGREAREVLVRDVEKRLHLEVLKNPGITDEEVGEFSAIPTLSPGALKWLARQPRHIRRRNVLMNILTNPGTPSTSAISLLKRLPRPEIVRIGKSSGRVRDAVARAARRLAEEGSRR